MCQLQRTSKLCEIFTLLITLALPHANGYCREPMHAYKANGDVTFIAVSSNGKFVASGCGTHTRETGSIFLWDLETGEEIHKLRGYPFGLVYLKFMQDDKCLIFAGVNNTIRICKVSTGEEVSSMDDLDSLKGMWSMGRSGMFGTSEAEKNRLWDIRNAENPKLVKVLPKFGEGGRGSFSRDGKIWVEAINATLSTLPPNEPCKISVWDVTSGKVLGRFNGQQNNVREIALSRKMDCLAITYLFGPPDNIEIRKVNGGKVIFSGSNPGLPTSIAFSPNGQSLAVGSADSGTIMIWDIVKKDPPKRIKAHTDTVQCLDFTPDGQYLISGSADQTVKVWKLNDLKQEKEQE